MTSHEAMTFNVDFRKEDGSIVSLTFGGIRIDTDFDEPKEQAIHHVFNNVLSNEGFIKDFGKAVPLFKTFKVVGIHRLSDGNLGRN